MMQPIDSRMSVDFVESVRPSAKDTRYCNKFSETKAKK